MVTGSPRRRPLVLLLAGAALCYAVGYPLALAGNSNIGWIFVTLGGPLLLAAGFILMRRLYASDEAGRLGDPPGEG